MMEPGRRFPGNIRSLAISDKSYQALRGRERALSDATRAHFCSEVIARQCRDEFIPVLVGRYFKVCDRVGRKSAYRSFNLGYSRGFQFERFNIYNRILWHAEDSQPHRSSTSKRAEFIEPCCRHDEAPERPAILSIFVGVVVAYRTLHVQSGGREQPRVVDQIRQQRANSTHLKCFFNPCQHSKYSCCNIFVSIANFVGQTTSWVSNMNASVLSSRWGFNSALLARSNVSVSGPCPDMQLCRLAPPGRNPSALASYSPWIRPMNSFITLRWNHGGRNVCSAT